MELLTKAFFCAVVCVLALLVGRGIARAVTSSGASSYGYDVSLPSSDLQSTDGLTDTLALSIQDDLSITATPIELSPRPTIGMTFTTGMSSQSTVIPSVVPSTSTVTTRAFTSTPLSTVKPTTRVTSATITVAVSPSATTASLKSTATAVTTTTSSYIEYTVEKGDTLLKIAKSFDTTAQAILELNQDITNPENLRIGQVLRVPSKK